MNYAQQYRNHTNRTMTLAIVALLHLALIAAVITGPGKRFVRVVGSVLNITLIEDEANLHPDAVSPQPVRIVARLVPLPEPVKPKPLSPPIKQLVDKPPPKDVEARNSTTTVVTTPPHIDVNSVCEQPEYPAEAMLAGEQGTVVLALLVGADGQVKSSKIVSSSGSNRLDEATSASLSLCHFTPATVDGTPVEADTWTKIRYVWKIEDKE
jgi:protein TonB